MMLFSVLTDNSIARLLLVVTVAALLFCTAVNCYTYQIAYPLWRWVGPEQFGALHREYLRRLLPVITLPHVVLFFSAAALLRWHPGWLVNPIIVATLLCSIAVIVLSMFGAGPVHSRFERNGRIDAHGMSRLLAISAIRSVLLLLASTLLLGAIFRVLRLDSFANCERHCGRDSGVMDATTDPRLVRCSRSDS